MFKVLILLVATISLLASKSEPVTIWDSQLKLGVFCGEEPCLFGDSIANTEFYRTLYRLKHSSLGDKIGTSQASASYGEIIWTWSDEFSEQMEITPSIYSDNSISFRDGRPDIVRLELSTELETLIAHYGEPSFVIPHTYGWMDMYFLISFPNAEGYFIADTRCDKPELMASTPVVSHLSTSHRYAATVELESIPWYGYTEDLPDCTIFQP